MTINAVWLGCAGFLPLILVKYQKLQSLKSIDLLQDPRVELWLALKGEILLSNSVNRLLHNKGVILTAQSRKKPLSVYFLRELMHFTINSTKMHSSFTTKIYLMNQKIEDLKKMQLSLIWAKVMFSLLRPKIIWLKKFIIQTESHPSTKV